MSINDENKRIIDHLIEQSERYDGQNLDIESHIITEIVNLHIDMENRILQTVDFHGDISTALKYQTLINRIQVIIENFYSDAYRILVPTVNEFTQNGYDHMGDLIDMAHELEDKARAEQVTEISKKIPDPNAVEFMRNHAFEQVKNISNDLLNQLKSKLGSMLVQGKTDKADVREAVRDIIHSSRSRADMVAQTELSMAYNHGAMQRFDEFNQNSDRKIRKYWHGFKYSATTCTYCRPRIGNVYDADDNSEVLPAHPRCRCVWLPYMDDWDKPIASMFTRNSNMINRVYSPDEIYRRINKRLGIEYSNYLPVDDANRYLKGDRSAEFYAKLGQARDHAIKDTVASFDIAQRKADEKMGVEFNQQVNFWKKYTAQQIVDNDKHELSNAYEAIKAVMILPWTAKQLGEWSKLLDALKGHL